MPNEITIGGGYNPGLAEALAAQQERADAEARADSRNQGGVRTSTGSGPFQGPTGASNLTGWDTRSPSYSPVLDGAAFLMGLAGDILTGSSRSPNALQTSTAAPGSPVNPAGGNSLEAFAQAAGVTPGVVQGALASVPSAEDMGLPNGLYGSMIPGSAPILDASGFNPVQAPGTIAQHSPGLVAPAAFSPVAAAVNQVAASAPAAGLLDASSGGGFPTTGDFSLAASDARMSGVTGFNDPLTGGYVDLSGGGLLDGLLGGLTGGGDGTGISTGGGGGWGDGYAGGSGEGDGPGSTR